MLDITIATRSERGRREANEDKLAAGRAGPFYFALLADGAGGHEGGAEASRRAIAQLEAASLSRSNDFTPMRLTDAVLAAHRELQQQQQSGAQGARRMHSTVVAMWLDSASEIALWSHVGDSRLYRLRHGVVDFVTVDDSVVQRMVDGGLLTPEQARTHPRKNQLIAALGIEDEVEPHTVTQAVTLEDGDAYLLCSDGWWELLDDEAIADLCARANGPDDWLDLMQRRIEAAALPRQDNFSAVAIWIGDPAETTRFMPDSYVR